MTKKTTKTSTSSKSAFKTTAHKTTTTKTTKKKTTAKGKTTRIIVKYDVGYNNALYVRGTGGNLKWEKGIPLKCSGNDEWIWEYKKPFKGGEFKVLINDTEYESGDNHYIAYGSNYQYTPYFS